MVSTRSTTWVSKGSAGAVILLTDRLDRPVLCMQDILKSYPQASPINSREIAGGAIPCSLQYLVGKSLVSDGYLSDWGTQGSLTFTLLGNKGMTNSCRKFWVAFLINKMKIDQAIVEGPQYLSPSEGEMAGCLLHCNIPGPFSCSPEKPKCAAS